MSDKEQQNQTESHWFDNKHSTILIVDDDEVNREFFEVMLKRLNFNVRTAADGEEALEKLHEGDISLVLLDNLLPKYSGWEVTRIIRNEQEHAKHKNVPIIMFSAMNTAEGKIRGYDLGIDDYITKPFNFVEVLARIKSVLRHRAVIEQMLRREKQIGLADALNKSLLYFSNHIIKETVESLHSQAFDILNQEKIENSEQILKELAETLSHSAGKILAALIEVGKEFQTLQKQREEIKETEIDIDVLDKKYWNSLKELGSADQNT